MFSQPIALKQLLQRTLLPALCLTLSACAGTTGGWNPFAQWQDKPAPLEQKTETPSNPFFVGLSEAELAKVADEAWRYYSDDLKGIKTRSRYVRAPLLKALAEVNAPQALEIVPVVESRYDPYAHSSVGATGLWQLMPATAQDLHIKNSHGFDGRRDIETSSKGAARFLMLQHRRFGNWPLAFAAYHLGPTAVQRRINRHPWKPEDGLRSLPLPYITKTYIRHLIGLMVLQERGKLLFPEPYPTETLALNTPVDIEELQQLAGMPKDQLFRFNPKLALQQYFGSIKKVLTLRVSSRRVADIPKPAASNSNRDLFIQAHEGELMVDIARRYHVSLTTIRSHNPGIPMRFKENTTLRIPGKYLTAKSARPNPLIKKLPGEQIIAFK